MQNLNDPSFVDVSGSPEDLEEQVKINMVKTEVWKRAVSDLEAEVMRSCASLPGGKKDGESVEDYAFRNISTLDRSLSRLRIARAELSKVDPT